MSEREGEGFDLRATLSVLRRHVALIVLCLLLVGAAALGASLLQEKQYSATASLLFRDPGFDERVFGAPSFEGAQDPDREAATNVRLVSLEVVADRTAEALGGDLTGEGISSKVEVEAEGQSDVVSVRATDPNPAFAADVANVFAAEYIDFRREADQAKIDEAVELVQQQVATLGPGADAASQRNSLQNQVSRLETLRALQTGNAELAQEADVPSSPSSPKVLRNALFGGAAGLLLGLGLALLRERLDRRLRDAEELEQSFGLPLLGTVPDSKELADHDGGELMQLPLVERESFRMLATRLRYFNVDREVRSVLVTSASAADGKSTVAWNLALSAASGGATTVILEADFHHPALAERLQIPPMPGLAELLTGQKGRVIREIPVADNSNGAAAGRRVHAVVAGASPPNPTELMESSQMAGFLEELHEAYDLVVIDTPPIPVIADAIPLTKMVSGIIVVGRIGKTTRDHAIQLRDQLRKLEAPVLGVVANMVKRPRSYGYGYYHQREHEEEPTSAGVG